MKVSERRKLETINTPYDDAFRTLLQDCPELVIPLINELFGTNYTGQEVVITNSNENFLRNPEGKKEKRITDSNLSLISLKGISKRYHLECQSTPDGTMEIRMWESLLVLLSRFPVGSSARMIAGLETRARAIATRCC